MNIIPAICVDNFYSNPDKIREYALSLPYDNPFDKDGDYPGVRTRALHEIDPVFFNEFLMKFFSIFYSYSELKQIQSQCYTCFHKTYAYDDNPDSLKNMGWIHYDDAVVSGIIYLNKNSSTNTGTSLYRIKDNYNFNEIYDPLEKYKKQLYSLTPEQIKNRTKEEDDIYIKAIEKNNSMFEETISFENCYNRMIAFDGNHWHGANNFSNEDDVRLTQLFFIRKMTSSQIPIHRMKNIITKKEVI
jgi:hypothetical protein